MSRPTGRHVAKAAAALRDRVNGAVHLPGDPRYDDLRSVWNRAIDPRPSLIVEAADVHDVQRSIRVAREHALPFAPQATGHGTVVPCDDGLLLITSRMSAVTVDPRRRTARVGPGARLANVIDTAQRWGLVPVAGNRSVGLAGFTLGGGVGWLSRRFGLAADGLLRATVVTSDGVERVACADDHPDLFWALRGGGGNFGVVTSLEVALHPVTHGFGGWAAYGLEAASGLLRRYRDWAREIPDEVNVGVIMTWPPTEAAVPVPLRGRPVIVVRAFCLGRPQDAQHRIKALLTAAGRPLFGGFGRVPVTEMGNGGGPPLTRVQHADLFDDLADDVIDAVLGWFDVSGAAARPEVEIRHWGGAIERPPAGAGPAGHRDCRFSVTAQAAVNNAGHDAARRLKLLADSLAPHATGGSFLNFLTDPHRVATAFTPADYDRLRVIKGRYDSANFFRTNHNIPPASSGARPRSGS